MQAVNPLVDLTAILATLASAAATVRIAYLLMRGRRVQARRVLTRSAFVAVGYLVVSLGASAVRPERSISLGERWCFDEWCVSVWGAFAVNRGAVVELLREYNLA